MERERAVAVPSHYNVVYSFPSLHDILDLLAHLTPSDVWVIDLHYCKVQPGGCASLQHLEPVCLFLPLVSGHWNLHSLPLSPVRKKPRALPHFNKSSLIDSCSVLH